MRPLVLRGVDVLALAGAVATVVVAGVYLWLIAEQDTGGPAAWLLLVLGWQALLCLWAASVTLPARAAVLLLATLVMGGLGFLAMFSVGLLFLVAGGFPFTAFLLEVTKPLDPTSAR